MNLTSTHEDAGLILGLAPVGQESCVAMSCTIGRRRGLDPTLLWLWCRPVTAALIPLLTWELPYAVGGAL